jgi:hypothetical protein
MALSLSKAKNHESKQVLLKYLLTFITMSFGSDSQ